MHLDLDVNTDLWPLELGERFTFALASTLSLDGAPDAGAHTRAWKTQDCHSAHASGAGSLWHALAPHGTPIVASSALAPRSTFKRPRAQAPMTRVISRRCSTSTSTPCTARYTSGSRRSPRRLCACPPLPPPTSTCPPPLTRWAEEFEQAYTFVTDPTGAAQEAAASGGGGAEPPAVVWRAYPEEWIVATKPKIGPPKQVGLGLGVGVG